MKLFKTTFLAIFALFLLQSCIVSKKANIDFFSKSEENYKGAKFVSINVPLFLAKPYIKRALRKEGDSEAAIALVKKVSKIKVLTVENGSKEMIGDYTSYLNDQNFEEWATIKHEDENVNIRVKQNGETINDMIITVNSDKEMVFVDVKGNFTADDISKMISYAADK